MPLNALNICRRGQTRAPALPNWCSPPHRKAWAQWRRFSAWKMNAGKKNLRRSRTPTIAVPSRQLQLTPTIVIAGNAAAVGRAMAAAKEACAKRALPLPVSVLPIAAWWNPPPTNSPKPSKPSKSGSRQSTSSTTPTLPPTMMPTKSKTRSSASFTAPYAGRKPSTPLFQTALPNPPNAARASVGGTAKRINKAAACSALTDAGQVAALSKRTDFVLQSSLPTSGCFSRPNGGSPIFTL